MSMCTTLSHGVKELEQYQKHCPDRLIQQMDALLNPRHMVYHSPDTVEHQHFSIDDIISEFKQHAPELHEIFQSLGKSSMDDPYKGGQSYYSFMHPHEV